MVSYLCPLSNYYLFCIFLFFSIYKLCVWYEIINYMYCFLDFAIVAISLFAIRFCIFGGGCSALLSRIDYLYLGLTYYYSFQTPSHQKCSGGGKVSPAGLQDELNFLQCLRWSQLLLWYLIYGTLKNRRFGFVFSFLGCTAINYLLLRWEATSISC